jgi:hypothetical protein
MIVENTCIDPLIGSSFFLHVILVSCDHQLGTIA